MIFFILEEINVMMVHKKLKNKCNPNFYGHFYIVDCFFYLLKDSASPNNNVLKNLILFSTSHQF